MKGTHFLKEKITAAQLVGIAGSSKLTSVEIQHEGTRLMEESARRAFEQQEDGKRALNEKALKRVWNNPKDRTAWKKYL